MSQPRRRRARPHRRWRGGCQAAGTGQLAAGSA